MRNVGWMMGMAVMSGSMLLAGCATDDSLPTVPRTAGPLSPDGQSRNNAEHRALEAPPHAVPTGEGREFPGQSKAAPSPAAAPVVAGSTPGNAQVATLADVGPGAPSSGGQAGGGGFDWHQVGNTVGPVTQYGRDYYRGPLPHLRSDPGTAPATGSTPVVGTGWSVDHSWGEVLPMTEAPHRAWPEIRGQYESGAVNHNPVYFYNLQDQLPVANNKGTTSGDWVSDAFELPWFYLNTAALPVLMVLEPPLAQRTTDRGPTSPNYHGYLAPGPTVPTPTTGVLHWDYPFLNPDGSVKEKTPMTFPAMTMPAP